MPQSDHEVEEVSAAQAHEALKDDDRAVLVDVRTRAEWTFVGLPSTSSIGRELVLVEWQRFPDGSITPDFGEQLMRACPDTSAPLYFICRSGGRSRHAAELARELGYEHCFNVSDGFEGPPDERGHRGTVAGWKAAGLPWRQS
jgi:rhodanese-related sulfurtransferase